MFVMPRKPKNIIGNKYGRLTVLEDTGKRYNTTVIWKCQCDCGNDIEIRGDAIRSGNTKSCGCILKEKVAERNISRSTHGHSKRGNISREYNSWANMKTRCYNPKNKDYHIYGGRGIKICERWLNSFDNFFIDMGERPEGKTLDRIDSDGNYEPSNCKWSTPYEQRMNQRGM
jgi:hypothetical protein